MMEFLKRYVPGPKGLTAIAIPVILWLDHHLKWGIPDAKIGWSVTAAIAWMMTHEDFLIKLFQAIRGAKMAAVLVLALALGGCAITPGEIQAATSLGVGSGLTFASIADPAEVPNIQKDARTLAQAINQLIPAFWPGATSAQLLNNAVPTTLSILKRKLASSPHGPMIVELVTAAQVPFASALGTTASPTAALSPTSRADALALFNGVSIAISNYLKDPSLMPPQQPAAAPPPPPAPAPTPMPPK